jgi:hypothetical protein
MAKARMGAGLAAGCLLLWGGAAAAAAPTAAEVLRIRPTQDGVVYTTPAPQEQDACKVELVQGAKRGSSGWLVRDARGLPLRRFFDTNGDGKLDVWSYYHDGVEVYREIDTNFDRKADQCRWLNHAGMKWGVDANGDGKIDAWKAISPEEVSQELLQAVLTRDLGRLQALLLPEAELKALELPAAEATRIGELQKQAPGKFQALLARATGLNEKTRWLQLETAAPQCLLAETLGSKQDVIKYKSGTVLCETGGKHEWVQTGEMIQVGLAWRLVDGPSLGTAGEESAGASNVSPELQVLLDQLREHDTTAPKALDTPGPSAELARYNLKRADVLERIVGKVRPEEREQWIHQVADSLSAAAQNSPAGDRTAFDRLARLEAQIVKAMPGSPLAGYVVFRGLSADYAAKLSGNPADSMKVQEEWLDKLAKFVQAYPKAEDTPDALLQLGMVSEFAGKESEAKKWYDHLVKHFADHAFAGKARGALRRLDLEGKPLELTGSLLGGGSFSLAQLQGKVVVVYYWASWNQQCVGDFAKLKLLLDTYGSKGLALASVNLDNTAEEAISFLRRVQAPGMHLHMPGGLESKPATDYGVLVLPNLFLVDKNGHVLSRTVQVNNLEDELKKLLK